jgi:Asp-tRNA(Asn)/Glu-tRNA(Gln) amidotransferase A subunit family amidase
MWPINIRRPLTFGYALTYGYAALLFIGIAAMAAPPRNVGDDKSPAGDNSQVLSPQSGFPAITVPMGYTYDVLPAGLTFLGDSFSEGTLIKFAYAYEQATKNRHPPSKFPPLK